MEPSITEQRKMDAIDHAEGKRGLVTMVSIKLDEYRALKAALRAVQAATNCPNCPNQGYYADAEEGQLQCEWCWRTENSMFNARVQADVALNLVKENSQ